MNLFQLIAQVFKPATDLIDNLHTSDEEKLAAKAAMLQTQASFLSKALEFENDQLKQKADIVMAEAKSEHWLTSTWRPITMLSLVASVMAYWFGLTPDTVPPEAVDDMFLLVQVGLGGYVVGRSAEKTAVGIAGALKKREDV